MNTSSIRCPFCTDGHIKAEPGKATCFDCDAKFEIDDRAECIFVDLDNPRLPISGNICGECGLVQSDKNETCVYCGVELPITIQ